jgi:squalene-hopene/tetraprenyl-beta-curcumene cyclase
VRPTAPGVGHQSEAFTSAAVWLKVIREEDGFWGKGGASHALDDKAYERATSTAPQTAWALLCSMAADQIEDPAGIENPVFARRSEGDATWHEERFTGTGFPRVFYRPYQGYVKFSPL